MLRDCLPLCIFLICCGLHPRLLSFPTRRSSDLCDETADEVPGKPRGSELEDDRTTLPSGTCAVDLQTEERSEEHTSELQSLTKLVCRLLLEKKKTSGRAAPAIT